MSKYKIAKVTYASDEIRFVIMRSKKHWLTGEEYWRFYESDWTTSGWTRWISCAETYHSLDDAQKELDKIIKADLHKVKNIETVQEYE